MVSSTLQRTVTELSRDQRVELRDFIDITLGAPPTTLTKQQESTIRRRAAQMDADPTLGTSWEDVRAELMATL